MSKEGKKVLLAALIGLVYLACVYLTLTVMDNRQQNRLLQQDVKKIEQQNATLQKSIDKQQSQLNNITSQQTKDKQDIANLSK